MFYLIAVFIVTTIATAQLPPFRFVGIPERHTPTGMTLLMNDRILISTDDETSTWKQRHQRFYIYHRSTDSWSPLSNLDTLSDRQMVHVLNDSLICVNIGPYSREFAIWNVDTDALVVRGSYMTRGTHVLLALHPTQGCLQVDQIETDRERLSIVNTSIPDGTVDVRITSPPDGNSMILRLWSRSSGGFWVQTERALWWTDQFDSYVKVVDLLISDACTGSTDGESIHVWRVGTSSNRDSVITYTSPTQPPIASSYPRTFASYIHREVDSKRRVWGYKTGMADGFYVASSETPEEVRYSHFDQRARVMTTLIGPRSWMAVGTSAGLMVSEDEGASWRTLPLPHRTVATIDSLSTLQHVEDGGVTIMTSELYYLGASADTFRVIGNDSYLQERGIEHWYHRDDHWMAASRYSIATSDSRGIMEDPDRSGRGTPNAFIYHDTVFVRWWNSKGQGGYRVGVWNPRSTRILYDSSTSNRFEKVYTVQHLSNGSTWFGGAGLQWAYSSTLDVEDIQIATMSPRLCPGNAILVDANERPDSLVVLVEQGYCYGVITHPLNNLASFSIRARALPYGFFNRLIKGHDQQHIGILSDPLSPDYESDSIYILDTEMTSAKVRRFENIRENRVYDIVYDEINQVYYALTARGIYRSDPVVTSVESDVQRPASDIPLQTSWYNTLGEQVSPPTRPGLYLKIEIDDKGRMVTEKVAIP